MAKLYFDNDQILRDLNSIIFNDIDPPRSWHDKTDEGYDVVEHINKYPETLLNAPITKYLDVIESHLDKIEIVTKQPLEWMDSLKNWLANNMNIEYKIHNVEKFSDKLKLLHAGIFLVDDFPFFSSHANSIIKVEYEYNKSYDNCFATIRNEKDMDIFLRHWKNGRVLSDVGKIIYDDRYSKLSICDQSELNILQDIHITDGVRSQGMTIYIINDVETYIPLIPKNQFVSSQIRNMTTKGQLLAVVPRKFAGSVKNKINVKLSPIRQIFAEDGICRIL
jgi:hypothetical protein